MWRILVGSLLLLSSRALPLSPPLFASFAADVSPQVRHLVLTRFLTPFGVAEISTQASLFRGTLLAVGDSRMSAGMRTLSRDVSEAFQICIRLEKNVTVIAVFGNPLMPAKRPSNGQANSGLVFGLFAALEAMGIGFFHPFEPLLPDALQMPAAEEPMQKPFWRIRGSHYHTEQPLALTEFLQGLDSVDSAGTNMTKTPWEAMHTELALLLGWFAAQRVNRFSWVLLCDEQSPWCKSAERTRRLKNITDTVRSFGIAAVADYGLAIRQQHAMHMLSGNGTNFRQEIKESVDWALDECGFDHLETEPGTSEFTHVSCSETLKQYNFLADEVVRRNASVYMKEHVSIGQTCAEFESICHPGEPLNFNFLPIQASTNMSVMAHTVQLFTLDDPTLGVYGNANFSCMKKMLFAQQERETVYYPETAYWDDIDNSVPLFMTPAYAYRAVYDSRLIARAPGPPIAGIINFQSGFEWTYWLPAMIQYRVAWNPRLDLDDDNDALKALLAPIDRALGSGWADWIVASANVSRAIWIYGTTDVHATSGPPPKLSGLGYMEGWNTFSQLGEFFSKAHLNDIQARKLQFSSMHLDPLYAPHYETLEPLLINMVQVFSNVLAAAPSSFLPAAKSYAEEMMRTANITSLRAKHLSLLYKGVATRNNSLLQEGRALLATAAEIVHQQEQGYRSSLARIAAWRTNPTSAGYMYLWTVKSLLFFWRDQLQAEATKLIELSPCFLNFQSPANVGFGDGALNELTAILRLWLDSLHLDGVDVGDLIGDCLHAPFSEPHPSQM